MSEPIRLDTQGESFCVESAEVTGAHYIGRPIQPTGLVLHLTDGRKITINARYDYTIGGAWLSIDPAE